MANKKTAWARRPGEKARTYGYAWKFIQMGPGRSIEKVSAEVNITARQLERCSTKWRWVKRAAAWDRWIDAQNLEAAQLFAKEETFYRPFAPPRKTYAMSRENSEKLCHNPSFFADEMVYTFFAVNRASQLLLAPPRHPADPAGDLRDAHAPGGGRWWRRLHISDKVQHSCAYLALSSLPVIGFRDRRRGLMAGLAMFLLGVLMEAGQHFSPGRAVELGDVMANGAGVSCGTLAVAASKHCSIHQTAHVRDLVAVVAEGVVPATREEWPASLLTVGELSCAPGAR